MLRPCALCFAPTETPAGAELTVCDRCQRVAPVVCTHDDLDDPMHVADCEIGAAS